MPPVNKGLDNPVLDGMVHGVVVLFRQINHVAGG